MNCDQFQELVGMRCNQVGAAVEVLTPFTFSDGDGIELFAQSYGPQIHFFDDGFTLQHLHSSGLRLGSNKKRWHPLKAIASSYDVTLSDNGVFETLCPAENASHGFARMMSTLLGVAAWEREQTGVLPDAAFLVDEVAFYLRSWKPSSKIIDRPTVRGFSGRVLTFDFDVDGQYIDAIQPHSASTGAELRKIIDLSSGPGHSQKDILVIVDDRVQPESAKQEIGIISRVSKTWPMSSLIVASGVASVAQQ